MIARKQGLSQFSILKKEKGEGMQDQEPLVIGEEDYTRTIYTVTLSRKLYDVLKKLTIESGNPYVGNTIVQLLEENPRVKKELEE